MNIEHLDGCTGCSACAAACPSSALVMRPDDEGFLRPRVMQERCTQCGRCARTCPVLNAPPKTTGELRVFAANALDDTLRAESSSGGVFPLLAREVIRGGGIVFGARFAEDFSVEHGWTDTEDGIGAFCGSKYLQSRIGNSYAECRAFLASGRTVLFSGTPCQIAGLKSYLGTAYGSLLTLDLICHGCPSPLLWQNYVDFREREAGSKTVKTAFRRKDDGWKLFSLSFAFANDSEYRRSLRDDPYMRVFLRDVALRPSCYACPFRGERRHADITLADFWGIERILPQMDDDRGTSLVLVHSPAGMTLFNAIRAALRTEEVDAGKAAAYNRSLVASPRRPKQRGRFYADLARLGFRRTAHRYGQDTPLVRAYRVCRHAAAKAAKTLLGKKNTARVKKLLGKEDR